MTGHEKENSNKRHTHYHRFLYYTLHISISLLVYQTTDSCYMCLMNAFLLEKKGQTNGAMCF